MSHLSCVGLYGSLFGFSLDLLRCSHPVSHQGCTSVSWFRLSRTPTFLRLTYSPMSDGATCRGPYRWVQDVNCEMFVFSRCLTRLQNAALKINVLERVVNVLSYVTIKQQLCTEQKLSSEVEPRWSIPAKQQVHCTIKHEI